MNRHLRRSILRWLVLAGLLLLGLVVSQAEEPKRKIVDRIAPSYPVLAREMALEGVVKLEALVAANGSVKTVEVKGGHPVLAQAAANAVRRWRWEPSAHESRETVQIRFAAE